MAMPLYQQMIPYAREAKAMVKLFFWTRQTLKWELSCESKHQRSEILAAFQSLSSPETLSFDLIKFGALVLGGFTLFCCCCQCMSSCCAHKAKSGKHIRPALCLFFSTVVAQAGLIGAVIYYSLVSL